MKTIVLKALHKMASPFIKQEHDWSWPEASGWEKTNKIISDLLENEAPCMIGRMGTVEGAIVHNRLTLTSPYSLQRLMGCVKYIFTNTRLPWWDMGKPYHQIINNAGFFSTEGVTEVHLEKFADLYLHYIPLLNVCGRFCAYEKVLPFSKECKMVQLETLYPFFVEKPWTSSLKGKKVLIVHPFKETIESQYKKRRLLFSNPDTLPDYDLKVIKAVQSIAGEKTPFKDWFEALDFMKEEISTTDFDVAIIGCGAYGLPLAGFIKEDLNKKAIHMGGGTQLLFGIKGRRWEVQYQNSCYRDMFNEYWVYPGGCDRPAGLNKVEGGCYW